MKTVILHYHIYKNSGTSFERVLDESFGALHERFDGPYPFFTIDQDQVDRIIRRRAQAVAFSSHQTLMPQPTAVDYRVIAALFLRHPILRIGSISRFKRQTDDGTTTSALAQQHDFAGWIAKCFEVPQELPQISNGQARHLGGVYGRTPAMKRAPQMMVYDLSTAKRNLANVELLGRTEYFEADVRRFAEIAPRFGLELKIPTQTRHNTTQDIDRPVADRVEDLLKKLSPAERQRLLAANAQDLELYDYGNWLIERGSPA